MPIAIPDDKWRRIRTQLTLDVPSKVIATRLNVSRRSVQRFSKNISEHGTISPPQGRRGRRSHITPQMEQVLVLMLTHYSSIFITKFDFVGTP
jgi:transposase